MLEYTEDQLHTVDTSTRSRQEYELIYVLLELLCISSPRVIHLHVTFLALALTNLGNSSELT